MPKQHQGTDPEALKKRAEIRQQVAERLKLWRESTGLKKTPLARRLGISHQRWAHYETGRNELDMMVALQLCEQEGLTMDFLYLNKIFSLPPEVRTKIEKEMNKQGKKRKTKPK